ncbi:MAG: signal peptidase I [Clostridia bacterium]|nr:signal peptidase I [Clostridia bacterium]
MKKSLDIVRTVITWVLLLFSVAIMIFTFVSVSTFNRSNRSLFGYKFYVVLSDSMKATDFEAGDVVVVKEVAPSTLKEGDIITFISKSSSNYGETVTHKIRRLTKTPEGEPGFVTYGTTTDTDDPTVVDYYSVEGKYQFRIPKVGRFFNFLKTVPGYICCILIPFLLFIIMQGINTVKTYKLYKKEQAKELQAEKDELAAEKKKTEEMMAELQALKAQLNSNKTPAPEEEKKTEDSGDGDEPKEESEGKAEDNPEEKSEDNSSEEESGETEEEKAENPDDNSDDTSAENSEEDSGEDNDTDDGKPEDGPAEEKDS